MTLTLNQRTLDILLHLASRPGHDEVKADFRQLLIEEFGVELSALEFERRVPEVRGRLDALIGRTIFEAKSDLVREWADVARRMPDYISDREREEGEKFVGVASDGLRWVVFELSEGRELVKVKETLLDPNQPERFLAWLDGAVALKGSLPPDPITIEAELGQESVAFRRASMRMEALWDKLKDSPAVSLKRQLWSQLLKLVYGREVESDKLWIQHTFLVVVAKSIALAVLGLREDSPKEILSGRAFEASGLSGAVESDFFDWIIADPEGEEIVNRISNHVRRFRLGEVQSDVLKILYESLIDRAERHGLGEYYTPDWLAAKVARRVIDRPLEQRVLDPACGSGTFLFHAVRLFLAEAREAGMPEDDHAREACTHVAGMDIHPVAVIIARVTFLLALGPALATRTGSLSIPVYLGDAMQLSVTQLMGTKELEVSVPAGPAGESPAKLIFPETFCRDPGLFDKMIAAFKNGSESGLGPQQIEKLLVQMTRERYKREINAEEKRAIADLVKTYATFDALRRAGRDSVWAYVARNLSRPLAFSAIGGWANVVIGNPPWVAYRHMSDDLQKRFRELAKDERVYVGGKFATQNDLCALFTVRAAGLYLRASGRLAFVLPLAVLSRGQFEPLRGGSFSSARLAFDEAWTMDDSVQPLFPVPACAVFARRRATATPVPEKVRAYSGSLPMRDASEEVADQRLSVTENADRPAEGVFTGGSVYRSGFRNGATLYPRMLCFVERQSFGRLGSDKSKPAVTSRKSPNDKGIWKTLDGISQNVEAPFIRPTLLGESILPYRLFKAFEAVIPVEDDGSLLTSEGAANRGWIGLHSWMKAAEQLWDQHTDHGISFAEQLNHYGKLTSQFPPSNLRVVYSKAGMQPAAMMVRDAACIIDHKLYWYAPKSEEEGHYLTAFLNSETARARVEGMQSRGQWGARDFDKVIFNLAIPRFDLKTPLHMELAAAAAHAEKVAADVVLGDDAKFQRARGRVRAALIEDGVAQTIDDLVAALLDQQPPTP